MAEKAIPERGGSEFGQRRTPPRPLLPEPRPPRARPAPPRTDVQHGLAVLWLHKWWILAITAVFAGCALLITSRQTPIYESQARVLVLPIDVGTDSVTPQTPNLATEAQLASSVAVAEIVAQDLDIAGDPADLLANLEVDQPADTEILELTYRDADPVTAQLMAQGFADGYLEYRSETVSARLEDSAEAVQRELSLLQTRLERAQLSLQSIPLGDPRRPSLESEVAVLQGAILQQQLLRLSLNDAISAATVVEPAPLPSSPSSPDLAANVALGLMAGLVVGGGLVFTRDRLSGRVRSFEEVEEHIAAPVLGSIPRVSAWPRSKRKEAVAVTLTHWRSPSTEAYRVLRASVLSTASAVGAKSILVTSAHGGEGRSATVANLGVVLAMGGKDVSLVSADLRRPRLHRFFSCQGSPGLTDVLTEETKLGDAVQEITLATLPWAHVSRVGLRILPSGHVPQDPAELLTSERMNKVLRELEETSDIVLIDVPPILSATDALTIAAVADAVLLVVGPRSFDRSSLTNVRQQLDRVGGNLLGVVLNDPDPSMERADLAR